MQVSVGQPISRRHMLERGLWFATALMAGRRIGKAQGAKARSVIQIWMWGGPAHLDTFDPKPEAGRDYCGPLDQPIETNVSGIRISQLLPMLARQADKYAIIRSMTHGINAHESASYAVQTGRLPGGRDVYPCAGAVVTLFRGYDAGYRGLIPPYIVLTEPQGRFSEAGFLGLKYKPFATGGDPAQSRFVVEGIVAEGISDERQQARRELLDELNTLARTLRPGETQLAAYMAAGEEAYELILGDARKVFDLSQEPEDVRERYGRNTFGQSCLVARRLVERGVVYVTINYRGWDTHRQHFQAMQRMLPQLDRGFATLLEDLAARGLLDTTIVWWGGEFGRTPRIQWEPPWNGGRGHWGHVFCHVVAGCGLKGGVVVGASDPRGEEVKERPVYPADLLATIYTQLGIDLNARLPHPRGEDVRVIPDNDKQVPRAGLLQEIL